MHIPGTIRLIILAFFFVLSFALSAQKKEYETIKSVIQQDPELAEARALKFLAVNTAKKNEEYIARTNYLLG